MTARDLPGSSALLQPEVSGTASADQAEAAPGSPRQARSKRFWQRGERAQSTTEFVVIFPALLLLLFLMLEFGWMLKNYIVITNTGREVARCAAVNRCRYDGAAAFPYDLAEARVEDGAAISSDYAHPCPPAPCLKFSIHYVEEGTTPGQIDKGDSLVVCIDSPSKAVTPLGAFASMAGIVPNPFPLKARTEMRVEVAWSGPINADDDPLPLGADSSCTPS